MKPLATIRPEDVDTNAPHTDYSNFEIRHAVRVILFNGQKVALLHVKKHGYYMLPGGGIDEGEDAMTGLARELQEELGCGVDVGQEIGRIETYFVRWHHKQIDTCYVAHKARELGDKSQTDFEVEEGHEVVWAPSLDAAIALTEGSIPENSDGKIVRARDLLFLRTAQKMSKFS